MCYSEQEMEMADEAVYSAKTVGELKKALQARSMLKMYGTCRCLMMKRLL